MLSGGNLQHWVDRKYLERLGFPPKYEEHTKKVAAAGHWARLTMKREIENYLHPDAIRDGLGIVIEFGDEDGVPELVAAQVHAGSAFTKASAEVEDHDRRQKVSKAKKRLNRDAAKRMTLDRPNERDPDREVLDRFATMMEKISSAADQLGEAADLRKVAAGGIQPSVTVRSPRAAGLLEASAAQQVPDLRVVVNRRNRRDGVLRGVPGGRGRGF